MIGDKVASWLPAKISYYQSSADLLAKRKHFWCHNRSVWVENCECRAWWWPLEWHKVVKSGHPCQVLTLTAVGPFDGEHPTKIFENARSLIFKECAPYTNTLAGISNQRVFEWSVSRNIFRWLPRSKMPPQGLGGDQRCRLVIAIPTSHNNFSLSAQASSNQATEENLLNIITYLS